MKVATNHGIYIVKWKHENQDENGERKTHCFVRLADQKESVATGHAICSPEDNFNKQIGRKLSLSRALRNWFTRDDRMYFWKEYDKEIGLV